MALDTFTYVPSKGFSKSTKPRVNVAQFGDGYSQRVQMGINNLSDSWSLTFTDNSLANVSAIITFFESHAGATAFYWTPPGEITPLTVVCTEWSKTYTSHIAATITCTFERVYGVA